MFEIVDTRTAPIWSGRMPAVSIASRGGVLRQVDRLDVLGRAPALDDAGALPDPLVGGVDRADDVVVRDDEVAAGGAVGEIREPASRWSA